MEPQEKPFQTNTFFTKGGYGFRRFNCNRELIPDCWRTYRENTFANTEISLGTKRCLETDDLRVPEISEKCSTLIEFV